MLKSLININEKNTVYKVTLCFLLTALVLIPEAAFAVGQGGQGSTLETTVKTAFCVIIKALTGQVGKAIATLAVIFLGIGAFFGKVNWGLALMFAAGIVAIFGAASIASSIAGQSDLTC